MFTVHSFTPADARELAEFINWMRTEHWSLTSTAFARRPEPVPLVQPVDLVAAGQTPAHIDTVMLRHHGRIVSVLRLDDRYGDGRVAVFSQVETHPAYQRRGTAWRFLGNRCMRRACATGYERLEAETWPLNRKGIPLYKRVGFRGVPGTSLYLENYLPLIRRHPAAQPFFARYDFLRTLQVRRSYGHDAVLLDGLELFEYEWRRGDAELRVQVDWQRQQIVGVGTRQFSLRCRRTERQPEYVFYRITNTSPETVAVAVSTEERCAQTPIRRSLLPAQTIGGQLRLVRPDGRSLVTCLIGGYSIPLALRACAPACPGRPCAAGPRRTGKPVAVGAGPSAPHRGTKAYRVAR